MAKKPAVPSREAPPKSRRWIFVLAGLVVVFAIAGIYYATRSSERPAASGEQAQPLSALENKVALPAIPHRPRPVSLDPQQFKDPEVRRAYEIARANPELLENMPCYCGCYANSGHTNNLDCFVDRHGET